MYNVANKIAVAVLAVGMLASCGNSKKDEAQQFCDRAESEVKSGNYEAAVVLLDTLDTRYADQVEVRRSAMKFRAMAVEGLTIRRITVVDDTLALLQSQLDKYSSEFEYVKNPGENLGGDFIDKSILKLKSEIYPKVNDEGYFTLAVKVPGSIGFSHVTFSDGSESASTNSVSADRVVTVENSEMTVLQQEDLTEAIEWLMRHEAATNFELVGSKSTIKRKLTPELRSAIITTWQFAADKQAYRLALIEREKLERKLQLCRNQLANVIDR